MDKITDLLKRGEATLDGWGKPGWIGAMVLGFIFAWPLGLALLFFMIWSGRMGKGCNSRRKHRWNRQSAYAPTGNSAFDAYREETLRRLEDEREAFETFLVRLREAKDQAEFTQFMDERRRGGGAPAPTPGPQPGPAPTQAGPSGDLPGTPAPA
ncbi:MAG: DUF2852 domain-containing protein [Pseudomonadota bacterium]